MAFVEDRSAMPAATPRSGPALARPPGAGFKTGATARRLGGVMLFDIDGMLSRLRAVGVALCGVVMAGTPLLLWVAWSETVFFVALIGCLLAVMLLGVCLGPDESADAEAERAF